jgi:YD repeat-containing protein
MGQGLFWLTAAHTKGSFVSESGKLDDPPSILNLTDSSGAVLSFKVKGNEVKLITPPFGMSNFSLKRPSGAHDYRNTLVRRESNRFIAQFPDGTVRHYRHEGGIWIKLDYEILPNGKRIQYDYSAEGTLERIRATDLSGQYAYGSIAIADGVFRGSDGTIAKCEAQRVKVSGKYKNQSNSLVRELQTRFGNPYYPESVQYNDRFQLTSIDLQPYPLSCEYSRQLNTPSAIEILRIPYGHYSIAYDPPIAGQKGGSTTATYIDGTSTSYHFNERLLLTAIVHGEERQLFYYDDAQRLIRKELRDLKDNLLLSVRYQLDSYGNPVEETESGDFGSCITYRTYDRHRLLSETKDTGLGIRFTYWGNTTLPIEKETLEGTRVIRRELYEYDASGNLIKASVVGRTVTSYRLRNQAPHLHCPEWKEERLWNGNLIRKTAYHYDKWGHVARELIYGSDEALAYTLGHTYNERGDLVAETNALGQTATYQHDSRGRCIYEVPFSGVPLSRSYDLKGRLLSLHEGTHSTAYEYDPADLCISMQDYLGAVTRYQYHPYHRKPTLIATPFGQTQYVYDPFGREVQRMDPHGYRTQTQYNGRNQPIQVTLPNGGIHAYAYFPNGLLQTETDPDGIQTSYTYDVLGSCKVGGLGCQLVARIVRVRGVALLNETALEIVRGG